MVRSIKLGRSGWRLFLRSCVGKNIVITAAPTPTVPREGLERELGQQAEAAPATVTGERPVHYATGSHREGGQGAMTRKPGDLPMVVVPRPGGVNRAYAWQAALSRPGSCPAMNGVIPFVAGSVS